MPNSAEKNRQRRNLRSWVTDPDHRDGGYWKAPVPEEDHGKFSTYSNWGCRCHPCEEANEQHSRTHRARMSAALRRTLDHIIPSQRNS